jgi:hypothetical protein
MREAPTRLDLEVSAPPPHPTLFNVGLVPSQALAPSQSITATPPRSRLDASASLRARPFRGFFPFSVFPAARSHLPPTLPTTPVSLRPQGLAPSRRLAPLATSRACSIPVPLLGFALRGLDPRAVPYALSSAGPLWGFRSAHAEPAPSGVHHTARSPPASSGVWPDTNVGAPLGFVPSEACRFR